MNTKIASADDPSWSTLLDQLHASSFQIAIVVSGGGSGSIANCFRYPGASQTFVEAVVAYSRAAMIDYLGEHPAGPSASIETANQLSRAAMLRCGRMSDREANTFQGIGISLVAALPTSSNRKGKDRIHVSLTDRNETRSWSQTLSKGQFTRASAESAADKMFYDALKTVLS